MKKLFSVLAVILLIVTMASCSGGGGGSSSSSDSDKTTATYSISGQIIDSSIGLAGVTVSLSGGGTDQTTTDASGNYSFNEVANGNYTITPSKNGYTFSAPISVSINNANITGQNFTFSALSSSKAITAFSLNGVVGVIDEAEKTISVIMPSGTNVTNLIATFTTTGTSVNIGSIIQSSGTTENDFNSPVTYTVTAADTSTQDYKVTVTTAASGYQYVTQWGSYGSGNGQFNDPTSIAVDASGNVYVADSGNHLIQKFSSSGTFITQWGSDVTEYWKTLEYNIRFYGLAVDASGNGYVADFYLEKFS